MWTSKAHASAQQTTSGIFFTPIERKKYCADFSVFYHYFRILSKVFLFFNYLLEINMLLSWKKAWRIFIFAFPGMTSYYSAQKTITSADSTLWRWQLQIQIHFLMQRPLCPPTFMHASGLMTSAPSSTDSGVHTQDTSTAGIIVEEAWEDLPSQWRLMVSIIGWQLYAMPCEIQSIMVLHLLLLPIGTVQQMLFSAKKPVNMTKQNASLTNPITDISRRVSSVHLNM